MTEQPDHLPPRDRRRGKRILTLRNGVKALIAAAVVFAAVSLWFELRSRQGDGLALFQTRTQQQIDEDLIVREAPPVRKVDERVRSPIYVERPRTEEVLGVEPDAFQREQSPRQDEPLSGGTVLRGGDEPLLERESAQRDSRIKISGDSTGVKIEKKPE
jgi:hypothetical protein